MKRNLLSIVSLLFLGITANAQTYSYSDEFTTAPTLTGNNYVNFTSTSDGNNWAITSAGYDHYDNFEITFPTSIDFSAAGVKPIVTINASTDQTVALQFVLVDENNKQADNQLAGGQQNIFKVVKDAGFTAHSCNFQGQFKDNYGGANGTAQGNVDSTKIKKIRFWVNAGYASEWPYHKGLPDAADFTVALSGTLKVAKLTVGEKSNGINLITENKLAVYPNPSTGLVNVSLNNANSDLITVSVSNVLGQTIYSTQSTQSNVNIDLNGKNAGIYYITVQTAAGTTTQRLFLN
ncbi:MAG: T9SS type A sorting domain-containing protein [Bacteroidetes bacterium]|nr:T9SS type A sorting domain-containing protein [Bacteroidota bacterium]